MNDWLQRAQSVPMTKGTTWYRYLVVDEADDLWVDSRGRGGFVRYNLLNPAHWAFWIRSRKDAAVVRVGVL